MYMKEDITSSHSLLSIGKSLLGASGILATTVLLQIQTVSHSFLSLLNELVCSLLLVLFQPVIN